MACNENLNFLELLSDIDEDYIIEADCEDAAVQPVFTEPTQRRKIPLFAITGAAACFALIFAAGAAVKNSKVTENTLPPSNLPETTVETVTEESEITTELTNGLGQVCATPIVVTDSSGERHLMDRLPISEDKLTDFKYEKYVEKLRNEFETEEEDYFYNDYTYIKSLGDSELTEVFIRAKALAEIRCNTERFGSDIGIELPEEYNHIYVSKEGSPLDYTSYFETGIKYDSFYNAYREIFTEESVNKMLRETFTGFYVYNGGLWIIGGSRSGGIWHSEIEPIKETDTEVEFNLICYAPEGGWINAYCQDSEGKWKNTEFDPEKRDIYKSGKIRNRFVKTEEGWRAEEVEIMGISSLVGKPDFPEGFWDMEDKSVSSYEPQDRTVLFELTASSEIKDKDPTNPRDWVSWKAEPIGRKTANYMRNPVDENEIALKADYGFPVPPDADSAVYLGEEDMSDYSLSFDFLMGDSGSISFSVYFESDFKASFILWSDGRLSQPPAGSIAESEIKDEDGGPFISGFDTDLWNSIEIKPVNSKLVLTFNKKEVGEIYDLGDNPHRGRFSLGGGMFKNVTAYR